MNFALLEPPPLLLAAHGEPKLDDVNAAAHQVTFEIWHLAQEFLVLSLIAEIHHALDTGAIIPASIKQNDLAGSRQMLDIALEIPLAAFHLAGRPRRVRRAG